MKFHPQFRAPHSPHRACLAFTMVEIAICLAVIGFALVAIIGVLPIGMNVQKDNREETVINFDAKFLMDAIRSGALGQDSLTNYIVSITNVYSVYDANSNYQAAGSGVNWFNSYTNPVTSPFYYAINGVTGSTNYLVNGANIIGLLSTPKYTAFYTAFGALGFKSNYVTADFRAITGSPLDQGTNQASHDFAFTYRLYPENVPFSVPDPSLTNYTALGISPNDAATRSNFSVFATNLQANLTEIRLRFRWPVLPGNQLGTGSQVYRTSASGWVRPFNSSQTVQTLFFFTPQTYVPGTQLIP